MIAEELVLDISEEQISMKAISETLKRLEDECDDKKLFHQIFIPLLVAININHMDIVRIVRNDDVVEGEVGISKYVLRKAFVEAKKKIEIEKEAECVRLVFEFIRQIGFSTLDAIKVFCNDRII